MGFLEMLKSSQTIAYDIFMAGDIGDAKRVVREYCLNVGFCVHIEPLDYIYTGGEEAGFRVGIRNYPRFLSDEATLHGHAMAIANKLRDALFQQSYMVVGPGLTEWETHRAE